VHDRRSGERREVVRTGASPLSRHELDDWYGATYARGLDARFVVLTGTEPDDVIPAQSYGRLARDLRAAGCTVIADLAGEPLACVLDAGLDVLKVSAHELVADLSALPARVSELEGRIGTIICTRAAEPSLMVAGTQAYRVEGPQVVAHDHRGAGDSFLAGLVAGLHLGLEPTDAVRLAAAAGVLNATRRGLGTGRLADVQTVAEHVDVWPGWNGTPGGTP
jgi:1-phosphofructokinase